MGKVSVKRDDYTGERFGYLVLKSLATKTKRGNSWLCKCDCGKEIILRTSRLFGRDGNRKKRISCGCKTNNYEGATQAYPKIYSAWYNMLKRCYNPKSDNYERYGGKGVTVCEEWRSSFDAFLQWALKSNYADTLTLDRIDNSKPYGPNNCRWVDNYIQGQNKGVHKRNKLGILGVCPHYSGNYRAYLQRYKVRKHLGLFKTVGEAVEAREKAEREYELTGVL